MGQRLLVVDSDRRFLQEHQATLESAFEVDFRDTTEGALAHLETGAYAAVLICVEASENKGYSLCSAIRRSPVLGDLKVALISAKATVEEYTRHQSLKGKADIYLHKPIRPNALVAALSPVAPMKSVDPDNPLGDLGGSDLGEEWLESLKSELESGSVTRPLEPAPPAAQTLNPVSVVLGLARPFAPLPRPAVQKPLPVPQDAGRVELLEARVRDLETKLVSGAEQLEQASRELADLRRQGEAAQGLFEEKTLLAMELETQLGAAREALEKGGRVLDDTRGELGGACRELDGARRELDGARRELEETRQQEEAARAELREKTQLTMDLMESNQLLQAQLAEAREDLERQSRSERALLVRNQELELERDECRDARNQMEAGLADLARNQAAHEEGHERQKMELLAAIDDRDARLARQDGALTALREQILHLEQEKDSAAGQLQNRSERLQVVTGKLLDLEDQIRQTLELTQSEIN
ncbi:MAG: response regulator [Holophaga sp.]|jgi:CheY-like chemotaxis protein